MIEVEICKMYKQISNIKYPTWNPSIINMKEDHLRALCAHVDSKIEVCDQAIKLLKNKPQREANYSFMQNMNEASAPFSHLNLPNLMQMVDFTNSINEVDGGMLRNMQQCGGDDACFGFVPTMATLNTTATTSHPSQVNCLQIVSQSQLSSTNQLSELEFEKLIMELIDYDWSSQPCDGPVVLHDFPPPLDGF